MIILFAIIKTADSTKKSSLKRKKPAFTSHRTDIDPERYFFTITAHNVKGKIDLKALYRYVGRLKSSMIFPDDIPKENDLLASHRLFSNAPDFLKGFSADSHSMSLCIYDKEGICAKRLAELIPFASRIHVICPQREKYLSVTDELLYSYGISVTISEKWNIQADLSSLILTPDPMIIPRGYKGKVLSTKKRILPHCEFYCGEGIILPYRYERLRPTATDKILFASALYEKCSLTELENCRYEFPPYY